MQQTKKLQEERSMGDDHLRSTKQNAEQLQRKLQQAQESAEAGGHAAACRALSGMPTPVCQAVLQVVNADLFLPAQTCFFQP